MKSLETVYQDLISASAGEISFETLIDSTANYFGAGGGIVFELNRETGRIIDFATPNLLIGGDDGYDEHINAINPRMRFSMRHVPGHVAYEGRFISERAIDRHEFYDWLRGVSDYRHFLGSRIYDDGDVSLFYSVEFSRKHGHPETEKIDTFRRLAPAIGNAWRLRKRMAPDEADLGLQAWLPDHLPWSIFALSVSGEVTGINASARNMAEIGDVIEINDRLLGTVDRRSRQAFANALRQGLAGQAAETLIETKAGGPPLIAQILPVDPLGFVGAHQVAALVYVRQPLVDTCNIGEVLGRLYGFTLAEQRLADVLVSGADQTMAAAELGLSRNTVRNRMQSMYAKSGTRRHSEFLIKVLGILQP
ncbi:MAG: hypothetical protein LJE67_12375 [Salaquimonas sp.]|jgi:DNA-binding CsgD family transcriptional regulator|nr:hypothetical protein [Salaquimonas sp.]